MLLQTNSYVVPAERRADHNRLMRRFRQTLRRLGCDHFEVYEQAGAAWAGADPSGRFVQILRFADRKHQLAVQSAEKRDPQAQAVIADFCDLIGIGEQLEQGLFVTGYYTGVLPIAGSKVPGGGPAGGEESDEAGMPGVAGGVAAGAAVAAAVAMADEEPRDATTAVDVAEPTFDEAFDAAVGDAPAETGRPREYDKIVVEPVRSFSEPVLIPRAVTASDPIVGDVLVGDDLIGDDLAAGSVPAPSHADDAGGTGLPAMFSDDYFDEPAAHGGPEPVEFDFEDAADKSAPR